MSLPYLLWHRSPLVPAAKLPLYAAGAVLATGAGDRAAFAFAISFASVELGTGVARRQWNDVHDYQRDAARGNRWTPRFGWEERRSVLAVAVARVVGAVALAVVFGGIALVLVLVSMLVLQWLYQERSSSRRWIALGLVSSSYLLRALAPAAVLGAPWAERGPALLGAFGLACAGASQVLDWRRSESRFLARSSLPLKPDSAAFAGAKGDAALALTGALALAVAVPIGPVPSPSFAGLLVLLAGLALLGGGRRGGLWWAPMPWLATTGVLAVGLHGLAGSAAAIAVYALAVLYRLRSAGGSRRAAYFTADR